MALKKSPVRERWRNGETALGSLTLVPEPSLTELVGAAGFDFMVADMEHAAADGRTIENMIRAAQAVDMAGFVRVREIEEKTLLWVLDSGADGIMLPLVDSAEAARRAYRLTRYPPEGERTLCSATRVAGRGAYRGDFRPLVEHVNSELVLIGLLETPEACDAASEIAAEGIDVFCVGRADLSMKMGLHYAPQHPRVVEVTKRVLTDVMEAGKVAGVLAYDLDDAHQWMEFGCRFVIYSQPEIVLADIYGRAHGTLREHARELRSSAEALPAGAPA
jgi:2-keto-3-deoxy-L-rhamnonate aldolase RhmA